jgi:hypothetical protein
MNNRLNDVLWIGGSPCSGKSTIAQRLSSAYGLSIYSCDDAFERHRLLVTPECQPIFARLASASCDELWLRPVPQQIEEELAFYREEFPFILSDLEHLVRLAEGDSRLAWVAEGAALLPSLLAGLGVPPAQAIWIVPAEAFQRTHYARRDWRHDVLRDCSDPEQGWENWMARDAGFARRVAIEAERLGYTVILVDGARPVDDIYADVVRHFGLGGLRPDRLPREWG